jgi:hypothetical protein
MPALQEHWQLKPAQEELADSASKKNNKLHLERQQLHAEELQWARRHLLLVEKGVVIDAFHRGHLSQAVQEKLLGDIDAQLLRLESGETDESNAQAPSPDRADGYNSVE